MCMEAWAPAVMRVQVRQRLESVLGMVQDVARESGSRHSCPFQPSSMTTVVSGIRY